MLIFIGISGFIVIHFFDIVSIKRAPPGAKPLVWAGGFAILFYSLARMCLSGDKLALPSWVNVLGWVLFGISVLMISLALFINLPFRKTYIEAGVGDKLIKTGLYALVRHPGVYWVALFFFSLFFVSESARMLIAAPIFSILNTSLVVIQDRYFFPRMFEGYKEYQKETPMLIPSRHSIRAFVGSLRQSRMAYSSRQVSNSRTV